MQNIEFGLQKPIVYVQKNVLENVTHKIIWGFAFICMCCKADQPL